MRRREFITLLGGAVAVSPLAARAQQAALPVIGFLNGGSPDGYAPYVTGFLHGLNETGYVEGKNVTVDYRSGSEPDDQITVNHRQCAGRRDHCAKVAIERSVSTCRRCCSPAPTR